MTTKPKAKKFRIRRSTPEGERAPEGVVAAQETEAEQSDAPSPPPSSAVRSAGTSREIDEIRREGLTARQLRMARRVAQKHQLAPVSDFDAVRLLRQKGIDPFKRDNMLELVVPDADRRDGASPRISLPQTVPDGRGTLPSTETLNPAQRREQEISRIQRDIARRRRRRSLALLARLAFFVFLPTLIAGWYYYAMATPMYATKSEFLIIQADGNGAGGMGGLLSGTQFATNSDSIATQGYLQSKDAMLRLNDDAGFKAHFTQDWIDPIQRLAENPTNEEAYKVYRDRVKIGYDPTEGVIRLEVIAADPEVAKTFSERLISYAEERVNQLSAQKREDQVRDAMAAFENAETERRAAQQALVQLQIEGATLDPEGVIAALRTQVSEIEARITEKEIELATLLNNQRPNEAKVDGVRGELDILDRELAKLNARMTDVSEGENSLAQLAVRIQMAQADLATRDLILQSTLQQVEETRMEANRQVRYLTLSVAPVASEEPSYPRAFENTVLAFLVFAGIYLMVSLTASILREQVSS